MSKKVEVIDLTESSEDSIPPFGSAKRPRPEVTARVTERTVPPHIFKWYGYVDVAEDSEEDPFEEDEDSEEDEDKDMSLQFQRPKGPDVNYVPKNIAKSPTFISNAVIGLANKTTWAMIEQKMGKRGAGYKGKGKEKV